jgi:carbonic anhydrase
LLDPIIDALPKIAKPKTNTTVRGPLKFQSLIWPPIHGVFYEYRGSLTTPPCSEVDTWLVFEQPIGISRRQVSIATAGCLKLPERDQKTFQMEKKIIRNPKSQ